MDDDDRIFLNEIAYRAFLETSYEDYLIARFSWFSNLTRQFFWSASQSIEKLIKCSLFIHGHSAKFGHGWYKKYDEFRCAGLCNFHLVPVVISAPPKLEKILLAAELPNTAITDEFLRRLCDVGKPAVRYDEVVRTDTQALDLYSLDTVFASLVCACRCVEKADLAIDCHIAARKFIEVGTNYREFISKGNFVLSENPSVDNVLAMRLRPSGLQSAGILFSDGTTTKEIETELRERTKLSTTAIALLLNQSVVG